MAALAGTGGCDSPDSCEIPVTTWEPGKDVSQRKVFRAARTGGEGAAHNASRRDPRRYAASLS